MPPTARTIACGPVRVPVIEAGAGGRPLLLVHGFTGAKEDFADHLDGFAAAGWHAVSPELRGHRGADHSGAWTLEALADDLVSLADGLGWPAFALVGHSMGGILAQLVALRSPERLTALVLMDTTGAAAAVDPALVELACEVVLGGGMAALLEAERFIGHPLETPAARRLRESRPGWQEYLAAKVLGASPEMYVALARELTSTPSRLAGLATLDVPTLVIVGGLDTPFLADSEALAAVIPGATLAVVPDAGHSPQHEAPEAWFAAVAGFLAASAPSP